ncbi:MAG TPA: TolC family protein, partial [Leptospiraceae bacterium]|nr:TolC family protein [Leptospiraceae bacterium]
MKQIWLPLAILWSIVAFPLRAEERLTLGEIWASVHGKSNAQKAAALELQASSIEKDRREWHWAPRIYAEGRAFGTNDPVMSFSSMLQTRNLKSADLSVPSPLLSPQAYLNPLSVLAPDTLNHPVSSGFYRGILGIELPVYEGGSGQARVDAAGSAAKAREWELQATVKQEYAAVAQAYAEILIRDKEDADLGILNQTLTAILSRYQLGSAANPVGRSGYLGM